MYKFKVGDEVVVVKSGMGVSQPNIGKTTMIIEIGGEYEGGSAVRTKDFDNFDFDEWIDEESFELINKEEIFYA